MYVLSYILITILLIENDKARREVGERAWEIWRKWKWKIKDWLSFLNGWHTSFKKLNALDFHQYLLILCNYNFMVFIFESIEKS
jgi:hypothetical protein